MRREKDESSPGKPENSEKDKNSGNAEIEIDIPEDPEPGDEDDDANEAYGYGVTKSPTGKTRTSKPKKETVNDFKMYLKDFMVYAADENDYTWSQPDRHYLARNMVIPGLIGERLEGVIGLDISPSIRQQHFDQMPSIVENIRESYPNHTFHVIWCDDLIRKVQTVHSNETLDWKVQRGNGTDFAPVFQWVTDNLPREPNFLIYLTDAEASFDFVRPGYHVLWALVDKHNRPPPFGEHRYLSMGDK